jgi:hypothetical protein
LRTGLLPVLVSAGVLCFAQGASAATLTVDDNKADCPAAGFTSVQAAVDAAAAGDTVVVCPGSYVEGSGAAATSALTITKELAIKGAGADLVTITPKSSSVAGGSLLEGTPNLRDGLGDIVAVVGTPTQPIKVDISGVTVDGYDPQGRPVAVEAGILFLDAKGSVVRSRVTNVVTSEGDNAYNVPGGWRGAQPGIGIVQTSAALLAPVDGARLLTIDRTRVDKYNKIGVLIDGAQNDSAPFAPSGAVNRGMITASQIVGRTECVNYAGTGDCSTAGLLTTGPLFGQDGVRVTSGSYTTVDSSLISQNLVNGTGAPTRDSTANNANLTLGAGVRYAGAKLTSYTINTGPVIHSSVSSSNIVDNAYGALNLKADGTTTQTGNVIPITGNNGTGYANLLFAENNWWGLRFNSTNPPPPNLGPAIAPTTNPQVPENPVSGTATADPGDAEKGIPAGTTSNSVDFWPYRNGPQANPTTGQLPILSAPIPVNDFAPTISVSAPASAAPGSTITLTSAAGDDFGVKRVRYTDGASTAGTATLPPYALNVTIPANAACASSRSYGAVATDSAGQTAASSATVTVTCGPSNPGPTPPTIAFLSAPTTIASKTTVNLTPTAAAGVKQVDLFLGQRKVCTVTVAPFRCDVTPTGADVGTQALRAVVTDATGATAQATVTVTVPKFKSKVSVSIKRENVSGGKARRTVSGKVTLPAGVTKAQGCSGKVAVVIKRAGRSVFNQQVSLSKSCTFTRSVTAKRGNQSFSVSAKFGGNAVLTTSATSRRFS